MSVANLFIVDNVKDESGIAFTEVALPPWYDALNFFKLNGY